MGYMDKVKKERGNGNSVISWGVVIAGAAVVAGACLVCPSLLETVGTSVANIAEWITGLVTSIGGTPVPPGAEAAPSFMTSKLAWKTIGATLLGGGAAYLLSDRTPPEQPVPAMDESCHRARLEMQKINGIALARMRAQGYDPAMAAQQHGR